MIKNIVIGILVCFMAALAALSYNSNNKINEQNVKINELEQSLKNQKIVEKVVITHDALKCAE